jgi:hypothetical protein
MPRYIFTSPSAVGKAYAYRHKPRKAVGEKPSVEKGSAFRGSEFLGLQMD